MKNNDLSNRAAPTIAFRIEDTLIVSTIQKKLWVKKKEYFFNEKALQAINYIFRKTDCCVDLVCGKNLISAYEPMLHSVPYNRLISVTKPTEIMIRLNAGEFSYYVDQDLTRVSMIGSHHCINLDSLWGILR